MENIESKDAFSKLIESIKKDTAGYKDPKAFGITRVDFGQINEDKVLQATYPLINWNENFGSAAIFIQALAEQGVKVDFNESEVICNINSDFIESSLNAFEPFIHEATGDKHKNIQVIKNIKNYLHTSENQDENKFFKICFIFEDVPVKSVEASYLKLYAISQGKVDIRSLNLNGAFGALPNVAWCQGEPIELDWLRENEISLKLSGEYPHIDFVDKFPRFLQHIIPQDNTRILETSKVRFGAQLAGGTTVMPGASYINFNAGTTGSVMVEGRISSSAIVGDGSDIGGGASILGVLSGTDGNPISIGKVCLLGANSTCGISLGNGCIIDAGLAILAGTKVYISMEEKKKISSVNKNKLPTGNIFKSEELSGLNGIHFRQDSQSGEIVAYRSTREIKLNEDLH